MCQKGSSSPKSIVINQKTNNVGQKFNLVGTAFVDDPPTHTNNTLDLLKSRLTKYPIAIHLFSRNLSLVSK